MLIVYIPRGASLDRQVVSRDDQIPEAAIWIDLINPDLDERKLMERFSIAVPTREKMEAIETSSRLYTENNAHYMTATLICSSEAAVSKATAVTFILAGYRLVTVRYDDLQPFSITAHRLTNSCSASSGETVLIHLLHAVIDGAADLIQRLGVEIEQVSQDIFGQHGTGPQSRNSYITLLTTIGSKDDLTSKVRESLVSLGRLLLFVSHEADRNRWGKDIRLQLVARHADVRSLSDHASYLRNKISYLLATLLGSVAIEQNKVIKIFSVAAVVLLPPTLVATTFSVNFKYMPLMEWEYGYPMALVMIVLSAVLPFYFFRWKKWL